MSSCSGCRLSDLDDGVPLQMVNLDTFAIDWHPTIFAEEFDRARAVAAVRHDSVRGCQEESSRPLSLNDCIKAFSAPEKLEDDDAPRCSKCKDWTPHMKRVEVFRPPPCLVIQLKRFKFTQQERSKISTFVEFPLEGFTVPKPLDNEDNLCPDDAAGPAVVAAVATDAGADAGVVAADDDSVDVSSTDATSVQPREGGEGGGGEVGDGGEDGAAGEGDFNTTATDVIVTDVGGDDGDANDETAKEGEKEGKEQGEAKGEEEKGGEKKETETCEEMAAMLEAAGYGTIPGTAPGEDGEDGGLAADDEDDPYELVSVVNHFGHLGAGHYVAYARHMDNGVWRCFNDSDVDEMPSDEVATSSAYLLFYARRSALAADVKDLYPLAQVRNDISWRRWYCVVLCVERDRSKRSNSVKMNDLPGRMHQTPVASSKPGIYVCA